jgi:hypothetical protein
VWSCRGSDGAALGASAWQQGAFGGGVKVLDTCAGAGSLRLSVAGGRGSDGVAGTLRLVAPAGTRIAGYELYRSAAVSRDRWWHDDGAKVIETAGAASYVVSDGTAGDPKQPLAAANRLVAGHAPLDALTLQVSCGGWCDDGSARLDLYRSRVTIEDTLAPVVTAAAAGDHAVIVNGSDRGGGVARVTMALDGGPPQTLATGCAPPYTALAPCPAEVARAFAIDAADGEHSASGTLVDAAGNSTAWGPVAITIRRAAAPQALSPASAPATPAAQVLELARATIEHAPGATARLLGTLRTASGAPVAGARLSVSSFDLAADDAQPRALPAVTTGADGAFTVSLARDGAQRVTVASSSGAQATATVRTRLGLAVASSRGRLVKGRVLTLRGKLRGAGPSARGAMVTIESIVNGGWQPVGSVRAKPNGRYAWSYRFVHLARDTIFNFRAVVERAPGWPWASERSGPLKVRVDVP